VGAIRLRSTTPKRINPEVRRLLVEMEIDEASAKWLEFHRPKDFQPALSECHINVLVQCRYRGGQPVCGWTIWQDKANEFVEAQFHTVWSDEHGKLKDVTPRHDRERVVLFVPEPDLRFDLTHVDHRPAVRVFDSVRMQRGVLLNGPAERIHICTTALIHEHNLVSRSQVSGRAEK
jgi:hypothetical protein